MKVVISLGGVLSSPDPSNGTAALSSQDSLKGIVKVRVINQSRNMMSGV